MAVPTSLHSVSLTQVDLPRLRRQNPLLRSSRRALAPLSPSPSFSGRHKLLVQPIFAQPRRSSSVLAKEELIASPSDLQYEGPLEIIKYPDPILRAKNKRVNSFDESLKKLVDEMFDVMYRTDGMGLSAPQVGINVQLMVFNPAGERGKGEEIVLVNPQIKRYSRKIVPFEEGCLSFPEIYGDVMRPDSLKVDAMDIKGARFEINLTGLLARVFQHEYDHLQGILFSDRMSDGVLETIRAELQALEKEYEERTGLASPEKIEERGIRKKAVGFGFILLEETKRFMGGSLVLVEKRRRYSLKKSEQYENRDFNGDVNFQTQFRPHRRSDLDGRPTVGNVLKCRTCFWVVPSDSNEI